MKVGIPKELKNHEYRVAITPAGVHELVRSGHEVFVQKDAGAGSLLPDDDFAAAGATILPDADEVWQTGDLILKVKEPVPEEYHRLRKGQVLFTYLHLAASRECTDALLDSGITAIAYETVQLADGSLPLLAPMSEVAGRMAPQVGAHLVIGAVLVPGAKAPKLVSNDLVSRMKPGSVLVDISIDQGGCFEDSHPTTHASPTYPVHNSLF